MLRDRYNKLNYSSFINVPFQKNTRRLESFQTRTSIAQKIYNSLGKFGNYLKLEL